MAEISASKGRPSDSREMAEVSASRGRALDSRG